MKTIDIKGKQYIEVNERLKYFRENYKDWALLSEIVSLVDGVCVIKATILNPEGIAKATGYAYEKEGSSFINSTSFIENCETSAWGRALGNLGIGIDTSIATADEVLNAQLNQKQKPKQQQAPKNAKPASVNPDLDIIEGLESIVDEPNLKKYFKENKDSVEDLDAFIAACADRKAAINGK